MKPTHEVIAMAYAPTGSRRAIQGARNSVSPLDQSDAGAGQLQHGGDGETASSLRWQRIYKQTRSPAGLGLGLLLSWQLLHILSLFLRLSRPSGFGSFISPSGKYILLEFILYTPFQNGHRLDKHRNCRTSNYRARKGTSRPYPHPHPYV